MRNILWLNCGPRGDASISQRAGAQMIASIARAYPDAHIEARELALNPVSSIDAAFTENMFKTGDEARNEPSLRVSETLIEELIKADLLVISTPMHNFTVPVPLKAWIDQVVRVNRTFKRTPRGKEGLLADKPAYVLIASGGGVQGDDAGQPDFLTPYLQAVLKTIGITTVKFFYLERMGGGVMPSDSVFAKLQSEIDHALDFNKT